MSGTGIVTFCHNGDSASLLQMSRQKKLIYLVFRVFFIVILRRKAAIVGQYLIARSLKFVARPSHKTNQRSKSSSFVLYCLAVLFFKEKKACMKNFNTHLYPSYRYLQQVISWSLQPLTGLRTPNVWIMLPGRRVVLLR